MDEIVIDIPRERPFSAVADLVLGGLAARHEVTIDGLDDLQLALGSLLDHDDDDDGEVTVVLRVAGGSIEASVGPVGERTAAALAEAPDEGLGLRRLLEAVVDEFSVRSRDGAPWVDLRKSYALAGAEG